MSTSGYLSRRLLIGNMFDRSSTLENWLREFQRFAPGISVRAYYADKNNRPALRQELYETQLRRDDDGWEVLVTTYNLAQGDDKDRKFFRKMEWEVSHEGLYATCDG